MTGLLGQPLRKTAVLRRRIVRQPPDGSDQFVTHPPSPAIGQRPVMAVPETVLSELCRGRTATQMRADMFIGKHDSEMATPLTCLSWWQSCRNALAPARFRVPHRTTAPARIAAHASTAAPDAGVAVRFQHHFPTPDPRSAVDSCQGSTICGERFHPAAALAGELPEWRCCTDWTQLVTSRPKTARTDRGIHFRGQCRKEPTPTPTDGRPLR